MKLMLFAQLHATESLYAMNNALLDDDLKKSFSLQSISMSQLSRNNGDVNPSIFTNIF